MERRHISPIPALVAQHLMAGADNIKQAIQLQSELSSLLQLRGFHLRKWASNSQEFLDGKAPEDCSISSLQIDEHPGTIKVLGLRWIPLEDVFTFAVNIPQRSFSPTTKRTILSESSRIFDPLGFLAPISVLCKIWLQRLWLNNYTWDNPISEELEAKWNDIRNNIHHIARLRIPRWLSTSSTNYELHGFSDASESAYAAVVYCRSISSSGEAKTLLFAANTKVAPIKQISIPRLELCGALLLAQLLQAIKIAIGQPDISCYSWTDSMVVLSWLSSHPRKWKSYVGNRTSEILSILPRTYWNYVPSKENPADIASRGLLPQHLEGTQLWWYGPQWLQEDWRQRISAGSDSTPINSDVDMEIRTNYIDIYHTNLQNDTISELFQQKSCLRTILRILGRCIRFYRNCRTKINKASTPWITTEELRIAMQACIRWSQEASFQEEIYALRRNKHLPTSSKLHSLTPFLDPDHILRVGGRLDNSRCSYDTRHPIILPRDHTFVELLIRNTHEKYFLIGTTLLLSLLRQRYWIISGRSAVKRCIHHCITCTRHRALTSQQLMAQLPAQRVSGVRAFENVGVDYAGPILLLRHRGRGAKSAKGYISLFVCLSTKALHLEIASDLSSEAFISCLKRFIARRGLPTNIYSDNGTNFVGANRRLCEIYKLVISNAHNVLIADYLSTNNVNWHFIPPSAPHFGGIWESGIKSVKGLLKKTIGEARLTFEELSTLVAEIEGVLNSRPLGPTSDDIGNINALTPAHFLIGQPTTSLPEPSLEHIKMSNLTRWRLVQKIVQDFWKRWHVHYLTSLQQRPKWRRVETNLEVGDLVIIREDNVPPATWVLARIEKTHPGKDQLVRVATVRTARGTIKRPVAKLIKLPIS